MEFEKLITDFATRHGVDGLVAEDNAAALDIDGIVVTIVAIGDTVSFSAPIGETPTEGHADFADMLLEANLELDHTFAKSRDTGKYILLRRLALDSLDDNTFDSALEALVNQAETWSRLLEDFRPAAEKAAEEESQAGQLSAGGFMQV